MQTVRGTALEFVRGCLEGSYHCEACSIDFKINFGKHFTIPIAGPNCPICSTRKAVGEERGQVAEPNKAMGI